MSRDGSHGLAVVLTPDGGGEATGARLRAELQNARAAYLDAANEFNELCVKVQDGWHATSLPDGIVNIAQVAARQRTAFDKYQQALHALTAFALGPDSPAVQKMAEAAAAREPHITEREMQVLKALALGKTTREIAQDLSIAFKTALTHRTHLLQKFDANNVAVLIRKAILRGYIQP